MKIDREVLEHFSETLTEILEVLERIEAKMPHREVRGPPGLVGGVFRLWCPDCDAEYPANHALGCSSKGPGT